MAVALVAVFLVAFTGSTSDAPGDGSRVTLEAVEVGPPDRPSVPEVTARVDTLAAVVADIVERRDEGR